MNMEVQDVVLHATVYETGDAFSPTANRLKRLFDLILCALIAPIVLILGLPIALLVKLDGGSVFFSQIRVGRGGKWFRCFKFRTMMPGADIALEKILACDAGARSEWARSCKLKNDPRITLIGRFLRRTSLDELPQFWNVLRGDMSIVGPRPVTREELVRYGEQASWYLACWPGITGLWQVSGRNDVSYARRIAMDVRYALTWSLALDVKIVLMTLPAILSSRGAY